MSFAYSAGTITQTGTNTTLAGLATWATVRTLGKVTSYDIGTNKLVVDGSLTIPIGQQLVVDATASTRSIQVNGTLTLGVYKANQADYTLNYRVPMIQEKSDTSVASSAISSSTDQTLQVAAGGNFYAYGVSIALTGAFQVAASAGTVTILNCDVEASNYYWYSPYTLVDCDVRNGGNGSAIGFFVLTPPVEFRGNTIRVNTYLGISSTTPLADYQFSDVPDLGTGQYLATYGTLDTLVRPILSIFNAKLGTDYTFAAIAGPRFFYCDFYRRVQILVADDSGTPIAGASCWIRGKASLAAIESTTDGSGDSGTMVVPLARFSLISGAQSWDYYSKNNDKTDVFDFRVRSFSHIFSAPPTTNLKGNLIKEVSWTIFADAFATGDLSSALALTGFAYNSTLKTASVSVAHTVQELYNSAKAYLTTTVAVDVFIASDGETIDYMDWAPTFTGAIAISGVGQFIKSTALVTFTAGAYTTAGLKLVGSSAVIAAPSNVAGRIAMTGTSTLSVGGPGVYSGGTTVGATSKITITTATGGDVHDAQAVVFEVGATFENNSGQPITLKLTPTQVVPTLLETSGTITLDNAAPATTYTFRGASVPDGSTIMVINLDTDTELDFVASLATGDGYTGVFTSGTDFTADDVLELRALKVDGVTASTEVTIQGVTSAENGSNIFASNLGDCQVYNAIGVDGSTVTGFTADYVSDHVDLTLPTNFNWANGYAWWKYNLTTNSGMRQFWGGITALDVGNFRINNSIIDMYLDNETAINIIQLDNRRIFREDEAYPVNSPTTGGGGIDVVWRNTILIAAVGSAVLPSDIVAIADAVWDEALAGHIVAGSASGSLSAILSDTNELQTNQGQWATASGFATPTNVTDARDATQADIAALHDFNPAVDVVANVTLVDTVTTNTDMRGTDGANTIPPDNASIAGILADTNELQTNQGDWITATGFATPANITDAQSAIIAEVDANEAKIDAIPTLAEIEASTIIAKKTHLDTINAGVKNASILVPHTTDL